MTLSLSDIQIEIAEALINANGEQSVHSIAKELGVPVDWVIAVEEELCEV